MKTIIEKGTMVRVNDNLSKTYRRYGEGNGGTMHRMRNKLFPVAFTDGVRVKIYSKSADYQYTFHIDDVTVSDDNNVEVTYPDPVVFNPNQLYME